MPSCDGDVALALCNKMEDELEKEGELDVDQPRLEDRGQDQQQHK